MAKKILGIDIGHDTLKLVLMNGKAVKQIAVVSVPQNLVQEGRVVSPDTMGTLIKTAMKDNRIHCRDAALMLTGDSVYIRNATMPRMNHEQLVYNVPFEFRDYITDEPKDYLYDYSVIRDIKPAESAPKAEAQNSPYGSAAPEVEDEENVRAKNGAVEILAAAVPKTMMADVRYMLKKAGLRMEKAAPRECAFISLIRGLPRSVHAQTDEFCFLDLGYRAVRMYMFKKDIYEATRVLEIGLSGLDDVLADAYNVDVHLAHTYLLTNYDNCQAKDVCMNAYNNIAVELTRALNFYRFSNPDSNLSHVWFCGGGARIAALRQAIADNAPELTFHEARELFPNIRSDDVCSALQAMGIALN